MNSELIGLKNITVKDFVIKTLNEGYNRYNISPNITKKIIDILVEEYKNPYIAIKKVYNNIPELKNKKSIFWKGRKKYEAGKFRHLEIFKIINRFLKGKRILELGCGENYLGKIVTDNFPGIKEYIGVDVYRHKKISKNKVLKFKKQTTSSKVPIENKSVDTLLIIDMLHHVDKNKQGGLIKESFSKLKPKGIAIIIEYAFSKNKKSCYEHLLANKFNKLSEKERLESMKVIDWIGNSLIRRRAINMPYAFRTTEDWNNLFRKNNMQLIRCDYLGFLVKLFHPGPYSLFILEKKGSNIVP